VERQESLLEIHHAGTTMNSGMIEIPLKSRGYVSFFDIRTPTDEELETCVYLEMTQETWIPDSEAFEEAEEAAME